MSRATKKKTHLVVNSTVHLKFSLNIINLTVSKKKKELLPYCIILFAFVLPGAFIIDLLIMDQLMMREYVVQVMHICIFTPDRIFHSNYIEYN